MDKRLIQNVKDYKFNTERLNSLKPVSFEYKSNNRSSMGIIAQDLELIEPLLVNKNTNGQIEIDYEKLSILLLAVVKELDERLKAVEKPKKKQNAKL